MVNKLVRQLPCPGLTPEVPLTNVVTCIDLPLRVKIYLLSPPPDSFYRSNKLRKHRNPLNKFETEEKVFFLDIYTCT